MEKQDEKENNGRDDNEALDNVQTILIRHQIDEGLTTILSAFYGKLLVVLGIAFPIIDALTPETLTRFNGFYLYLNLGSILFLIYSYALLIREETNYHSSLDSGINGYVQNHGQTFLKRQIRFGSNYLRMGVAGFGIGSMIFSGIEFGRYFELNGCKNILMAVSPLSRIVFVLMQMLFVFKNNTCKNDHMIMAALLQNASPYLFPCTVEYSLLCAVILAVMWNHARKTDYYGVIRSCNRKGHLAILNERGIMMLKDRQSGVNIIYSSSVHKFSVDCAHSYKGLFSGILILVLTIISLIMFFELTHVNIEMAVLQVNIWEATLFGIAITATLACALILRKVSFRKRQRSLQLEHILLLVTQCGVFLYFLFQILGGYYSLQNGTNGDPLKILRLITPIAALVQSSCQTILILDAWRRRCSTSSQIRRKPGRELVTFLLITNLALWGINRLKNNCAEFHPMQMEFYGVWAWTVITHVSMPLVVCYRFQSTVCLYEIWLHVYKPRPVDKADTKLENVESAPNAPLTS